MVFLSAELPFLSFSIMAAALGIVADVPGVAAWCQRANMGLVIKILLYVI